VSVLQKVVYPQTLGSSEGQDNQWGSRENFLLKDLLASVPEQGAECDPAVRLLWEEFQTVGVGAQETCTVRVGQVLLLSGVLPTKTPLYDLTVEEDHSFIVEGLKLHNSNCRDRLLVRIATLEQVIAVNEAGLTRGTHIKNLRKLKRDGHL
jgi:hypothetical protein